VSKHRRAAKVDDNEKAIRDALIQIPGVSVAPDHDDILVGYRRKTYWIEVKNPDCVAKDGSIYPYAIKPSQKELLENWTGSYHICWNLDQILKIIGCYDDQ